jgi:hypothetical protein
VESHLMIIEEGPNGRSDCFRSRNLTPADTH